ARSSYGAPLTDVNLVSTDRLACSVAAFPCSGVSKSGSPTVRLRTSTPWARRSRTLWVAAVLGDSLILVTRSARGMAIGSEYWLWVPAPGRWGCRCRYSARARGHQGRGTCAEQ